MTLSGYASPVVAAKINNTSEPNPLWQLNKATYPPNAMTNSVCRSHDKFGSYQPNMSWWCVDKFGCSATTLLVVSNFHSLFIFNIFLKPLRLFHSPSGLISLVVVVRIPVPLLGWCGF